MNDRERLIDILYKGFYVSPENDIKGTVQKAADYLISHGVTVQKHGEADNIEVQFIGIEQPDRSKEIYTFVFDFEINGVDYHYRQQLTSELFETFEYKKEKHGRWIKLDVSCGIDILECSECHSAHPNLGDAYCKDCGAIMDGEAHE